VIPRRPRRRDVARFRDEVVEAWHREQPPQVIDGRLTRLEDV